MKSAELGKSAEPTTRADDRPFDSQITFLFVSDLARSAQFYGELLGLELVRDQGACLIYRFNQPLTSSGISQ